MSERSQKPRKALPSAQTRLTSMISSKASVTVSREDRANVSLS